MSTISESRRKELVRFIFLAMLSTPSLIETECCVQAADQNAVWDGTDGNWSDALKWSASPLFPSNGNGGQTFDATINSGNVNVDIAAAVEEYSQDGGVVTVSGEGSLLTANGQSSLASESGGTLRIENEGNVELKEFSELGELGQGLVEVRSGGSLTTNGAELGGASLSGIFIDERGFGEVLVEGATSQWVNEGNITLGSGGFGTINVREGGRLTSTRIDVGRHRSNFIAIVRGEGEITVTGNESRLTVGPLFIGSTGFGDVSVEDNGTIEAENIYVSERGSLRLAGGTVIANAQSPFYGLQISDGGDLYGSGVVQGRIDSTGRISPGLSSMIPIGSLMFDGIVRLRNSAQTVFQLDTSPSGIINDHIDITGDLTIGGELVVELRNGLQSQLLSHGIFTLATVTDTTSTLTGEFVNVANNTRLGTSDGVGSFLVHYGAASIFDPKSIVLSDFQIRGDYNGDGVVDAADYTVWRDMLGQTGPGLAADGTGPDGTPDGIVDQLDYQFWKANFGNTLENVGAAAMARTASAAASPFQELVPEPASLLLLAAAALAFTPRRRRG